MSKISIFLRAAGAVLLLSSTAAMADAPAIQQIAKADAVTRQKAMNDRSQLDLSVVYVARLKPASGKQIDVTSLAPALVAQVTSGANGPAMSIIRFSKDRKMLEFFSRDPVSGTGLFTAMPIDTVPASLTFPVIANGKLVPTEFELLMVTHKP